MNSNQKRHNVVKFEQIIKKERPKTVFYHTLMPHYRPGLDELAAIFMLKSRLGQDMFGIDDQTKIRMMSNGDFENPIMDDVPGTLYLGCGRGSWANEHFLDDSRDSSCCKLVANKLGIFESRFVNAVTYEDRNGTAGTENHLAQVVKDLYDIGWLAPEVYEWAADAFRVLTNKQFAPNPFVMNCEAIAKAIENRFGSTAGTRWYSVVQDANRWAKTEYAKAMSIMAKAKSDDFVIVDTYLGQKKAYIPSDVQTNQRIGAAARSKGHDCEILLMQGALDFNQVGVILQQKHTAGLSFALVLEELRRHELLARKTTFANVCNGLDQCAGEGTVEACPIWHGHQASTGQNLCFSVYNRAKTRPNSQGTKLGFEYIKDLFISTISTRPCGELSVGANNFLTGGGLIQGVC